jgi:1-aminocyclopropane-1-carboxylate deaminase/D-cysteine desulfhydrase-like pyridoxal-dependent ACC family enzyme
MENECVVVICIFCREKFEKEKKILSIHLGGLLK